MRSDELDYDLPPELIAQRPADRRDGSRLLVYDRATGAVRHRLFADLPEEIGEALVVINDTKVVPARLHLQRETGGQAEVLLLEPLGAGLWEALARPSRRLRPGERLGPVELLEALGDGRWRVRLDGEPDGEPPLPPYIHEPLADVSPLPDRLRRRPRFGRRPHGRSPLHAGSPREARRGAGHAPRRARHVQAACRRRARRSRAAR